MASMGRRKLFAGAGEQRQHQLLHAQARFATSRRSAADCRSRRGRVVVTGRKITLHLPPATITDAYLDEKQTQVIDWQRGFLRTFDKDLEQTARQDAVDDISRAARLDGILNDADRRARLELALFLHQAGFDPVEFVDKSPGGPAHEDVPKF
jgi:hypothetical protein